MEYHVTDFPKSEFLRLWDVVLVAREGIPIRSHIPALYRVSDRPEDLCETDRPVLAKPDYVGLYFHNGQVWFKPGEPFRDMQDTALHELSHHEVPYEAHGRTWRKVFGTSLALYLRETGMSWSDIEFQIYTKVVWHYRSFRKITDLKERSRIVQSETEWIMRHALNRIPTLTERGRRA